MFKLKHSDIPLFVDRATACKLRKDILVPVQGNCRRLVHEGLSDIVSSAGLTIVGTSEVSLSSNSPLPDVWWDVITAPKRATRDGYKTLKLNGTLEKNMVTEEQFDQQSLSKLTTFKDPKTGRHIWIFGKLLFYTRTFY